MKLLERLFERSKSDKKLVDASKEELVAIVAQNGDWSEDEVFARLDELGMSIEDLGHAVKEHNAGKSRKQRRLAAVKAIADAEAMESEMQSVSAEQERAKAVLTAEIDQANAKYDLVHRRWDLVRERKIGCHAQSQKALRELLETCDPELKRREKELMQQLATAMEAVKTLSDYCRSVGAHNGSGERLSAAQKQVRQLETDLAAVQAEKLIP